METFRITLKNEKRKTYKVVILFFVILHVLFFCCLLFDGTLWKTELIVPIIIIDLFLFSLGMIALKKTSLYFTTSGIEKKNIPSKNYEWDQFSNIVLKDNLLTLDFKNNKLLQAEIDNPNINEDAFNTFAKQQLVNA